MTYSESVTESASVTPDTGGALLAAAVNGRTELKNEIYVRYRRPLMQVFLQRRIDRDAAQDLLQRTFLQAIKKIRAEGLDDPSNLGGYLYRTACKLATAYWRGELSRRHESDGELLSNLQDDSLSLEESLDHDLRGRLVRELMRKLSVARDREVLERFYLKEESRSAIRESMNLTELQFNQVLWRARQRFAETLRKQGFAEGTATLDELPRLAENVAAGGAELRFRLTAGLDKQRRKTVSCIIEGFVFLLCQKSLEAFRHEVSIHDRLVLVDDESGLPPIGEESDEEDFVVADEPLSVLDLVEDAVLLSLPMVPRKPGLEERGAPDSKPRSESPFAALAKLKKQE